MRVGYLRQYILSEGKNEESSRNPVTMALATSAPLRVLINHIHGGPLDEEYNSKQKKTKATQSRLYAGTS